MERRVEQAFNTKQNVNVEVSAYCHHRWRPSLNEQLAAQREKNTSNIWK